MAISGGLNGYMLRLQQPRAADALTLDKTLSPPQKKIKIIKLYKNVEMYKLQPGALQYDTGIASKTERVLKHQL